MYRLIYYERPDGKKTVHDWLDAQDNSIKPNIYKKLDDLRKNGPASARIAARIPENGEGKKCLRNGRKTLLKTIKKRERSNNNKRIG